jgi:hypothetical protein
LPVWRGTESSNPLPSSGESCANLLPRAIRADQDGAVSPRSPISRSPHAFRRVRRKTHQATRRLREQLLACPQARSDRRLTSRPWRGETSCGCGLARYLLSPLPKARRTLDYHRTRASERGRHDGPLVHIPPGRRSWDPIARGSLGVTNGRISQNKINSLEEIRPVVYRESTCFQRIRPPRARDCADFWRCGNPAETPPKQGNQKFIRGGRRVPAHVASQAAKRRPDKKSSWCSGFR